MKSNTADTATTVSQNSTPSNQSVQDDNKNNSNDTSAPSQNTTPSIAPNKNNTTTPKTNTSSGSNTKNEVQIDKNISEKVKNYILNGQGDKSNAESLLWSKTFLDRVDVDSLYKKYLAGGGKADDIEKVAKYVTLNAPIQNDWQDMFKKDLYSMYGQTVVRLEPLGNNMYQAYVKINGSEVPYVTVSARTGYFHG